MQGPMVRGAQGDEVVFVMRATLGPPPEVMHVQEGAVRAAGHDAATVIAVQHATADGGRNVLARAPGSAHVGAPESAREALRIAVGHLHDFGFELDQATGGLLEAAPGTDRKC
jgi:hypothetical protein